MSYTSDANATYVNGEPVDKADVRSLWSSVDEIVNGLLGKADLANSGRFFTSRAAAVSIGQSALPGTLGLIMTVEDGWLAVRSFSNAADDPLFGTQPSWGVALRAPNAATLAGALNVASVIPLINIGGTGNAITADLAVNAVAAGASVTASTSVRYIPAATNSNDGETDVTLFIAGDEPRIVRTADGARLPAGFFVSGRAYTLDRRGAIWRVATGGVDRVELAGAVNAAAVIPLVNIGGTGATITADLAGNAVAAGASVTSSTSVRYIPTAANANNADTDVTLHVSGDDPRIVRAEDGGRLPAGFFVVGRAYVLDRRGAVWRVQSGGVSKAQLDAKADLSALASKADVAAGGRFYANRALAAAAPPPPATIGRLYVANGGWIEVRGATSQVDPLYPTAPYWGIIGVHSSSYITQHGSLWRLSNTWTTAGPYRASLPAGAITILNGEAGVAGDSTFEFVPVRNSEANPSLIVDGDTERLILSREGNALPTGYLKAGVLYLITRRGEHWRLIYDDQPALPADIVDRIADLESGLASEQEARALGDAANHAEMVGRDNARIADIAELEGRVAAFEAGARIVGDWDASGGAFPVTRPDASAIEAGDQFNVTAAGVVDGVAFAAGDILTALVAGGGTVYAGTWSRRAGTATAAAQVSTSEGGVSVQDRLDLSGRVFATRADLAATHIPASVSVLRWAVWTETPEVVRTADLDAACLVTADGAMWAPKGAPTPLHFGAVGDGLADDTAPFQAFVDHIKLWGLEGRLPAGFKFSLSTVNMWSSKAYGIVGDGCRQSYVIVSNPDRTSAGLRFTHPTIPSQRVGGGIILRDFGIFSAPGNRAALYEHRYCSGIKMQRVELRPQEGAGVWNDTKIQMLVLSKCWNVDLSEVSVWRGGVNFPVFTVPPELKFNAGIESDIISTSDGSSFFTADMEGKYLTLMSGSLNQTFLVDQFISGSQVKTDVAAETNFLAATGCFGGVRGSMELGSDVLQIERAVLSEADIGRRVYVVGADTNTAGRTFPLWARVVDVDGMSITLDAPAGRSVTLAELIFDPAVDFGSELAKSAESSNDLKFNDLHIEQCAGTALVISGNKVDGSDIKLHANGQSETNDLANNIQLFAYNWNGYLSGGFVQRVAGNRSGRILLTSQTAPTYFGPMHTLLHSSAPLIKLDQSSLGAMADIEGVYHIEGSVTQSMLNRASEVSGFGAIRFGSIGGAGRAPLMNPGFAIPTYTVATLPDPAFGPGPVFVSDAPGGMVMAFSDGVNWMRIADRNVIA